jgi:hypothetical protein
VRNARLSNETQVCSSGYRGSAGTRTVLKAAHIGRCYGCDAGVGLVVFGLADGDPFFGFWVAVDDELGETI